ncbi:MAG: hypothetical protein IJW73_00520 [Candidatus Gastranaerophilales bacterium]|nr:hypothetical protein [Candidatus Gastranaerophilales bacterium]
MDIDLIGKNILEQILEDCELHFGDIDNHNEEQMKLWDLKLMPLLAQEFYEMANLCDTSMIALIGSNNLGINLFDYMRDKTNEFGLANALTEAKFNDAGMNYNAWLKPDKKNEVQFKYQDTNQEKLVQVIAQIEEDIEVLRKTPAKNFIDRNFEYCIENSSKFKIPQKYAKNKQLLLEFMQNLYNSLDKNVFARAEKNLQNEAKKQNAQLTMTIKNHLEQRIEDINKIGNSKAVKQFDLTIKMWDRIPQKDLFQGNYSTCCIGMGKDNGRAMPHYLLNSMFNMIEVVDNKTDKTIGNALCYFVKNENDEIIFVVDNIEIANKHKPSNHL